VAAVYGILSLAPGLGVHSQSDLLAGHWRVNLAKSIYEPGPPPAVAPTITYTRTADGYDWSASGGASGTITFDGKFRPVAGVRNYDEIAFTPRDAYTTEVTRRRGGGVVQTGLRVLSRDGTTLTITFDGIDADGRTIHERVVYEKQR
jgi:hypothetical protein